MLNRVLPLLLLRVHPPDNKTSERGITSTHEAIHSGDISAELLRDAGPGPA